MYVSWKLRAWYCALRCLGKKWKSYNSATFSGQSWGSLHHIQGRGQLSLNRGRTRVHVLTGNSVAASEPGSVNIKGSTLRPQKDVPSMTGMAGTETSLSSHLAYVSNPKALSASCHHHVLIITSHCCTSFGMSKERMWTQGAVHNVPTMIMSTVC